MKTKKAIASYEDMLDMKAKTSPPVPKELDTYEKDLNKEVDAILELLVGKEVTRSFLKILVGKNLINISDVKRILGD